MNGYAPGNCGSGNLSGKTYFYHENRNGSGRKRMGAGTGGCLTQSKNTDGMGSNENKTHGGTARVGMYLLV